MILCQLEDYVDIKQKDIQSRHPQKEQILHSFPIAADTVVRATVHLIGHLWRTIFLRRATVPSSQYSRPYAVDPAG